MKKPIDKQSDKKPAFSLDQQEGATRTRQLMVNPRVEFLRAQEDKKRGYDGRTLGGLNLKMDVTADYNEQLEGYHAHWFKDSGGRIDSALQQGYVPVYSDGIDLGADDYDPDRSTWVTYRTGTDEAGSGQLSYLMKIRQEYYDEDQAIKQQSVQLVDEQIKGGGVDKHKIDNAYVMKNESRSFMSSAQ